MNEPDESMEEFTEEILREATIEIADYRMNEYIETDPHMEELVLQATEQAWQDLGLPEEEFRRRLERWATPASPGEVPA